MPLNDVVISVGKSCPFCQKPIEPGMQITICAKCGIPHHVECWNENRGCTTFGCVERQPCSEPCSEGPIQSRPADVIVHDQKTKRSLSTAVVISIVAAVLFIGGMFASRVFSPPIQTSASTTANGNQLIAPDTHKYEPSSSTDNGSSSEAATNSTEREVTNPSSAPGSVVPSEQTGRGRWPWCSERAVSNSDIASLSASERDIMRNEIYARHGWVFVRKDLQAYFDRQTWYHPGGPAIDRNRVNKLAAATMSKLERANAQAILDYQKANGEK